MLGTHHQHHHITPNSSSSHLIYLPYRKAFESAMKSSIAFLCVVVCALHHEGSAFSTFAPSRQSSSSSRSRPCRPTSLPAAVVGSSSSSSNDEGAKLPHRTTIIQQRELDTIRKELIQKYITLGHSEEYASREVNYFLEDAERSKQYVEMRRIAMARGNDLGIENVVQFAAAFLVGMVGSWALDSLHTLQVGDVVLFVECRESLFSFTKLFPFVFF